VVAANNMLNEEQMKKIYDDILSSIDSTDKKKGVMELASYGKKAIPFIQELRNMETNEDMKNYLFDTITQIEKGNL
jgi:thiamine phosphate synthase YjbQ (UPF0047 family)